MKKITMLIALLFTLFFSTKSEAQTIAQMQDTIGAVAPHLPLVHRYTGVGKQWYGLDQTSFTHETQDSVVAWIANYPSESNSYYSIVGAYLNSTDISTLSSGDADIYKNIHAVWIMIHAND